MQSVPDPVSSHPTAKRHYRSVEERRCIVEETLVPGVSVATVARAHGVNANQVFGWRKLYHAGLLGPKESSCEALQNAVHLLPVRISSEEQASPPLAAKAEAAASSSGLIELILAKARVRISGQVD